MGGQLLVTNTRFWVQTQKNIITPIYLSIVPRDDASELTRTFLLMSCDAL